MHPAKSFRNYAKEAMQKADGNVAEASKILEKTCRQNTEAWLSVTEPVLSSACYNAVRGICQEERRAIWYSPNYSAGGNGDRVVNHAKSLMDWPLPGGMRLRDAKANDLIAAAEFYRKQAQQMFDVAGFLEKIAEKVGRKKVENALTEAELIAMRGAS